MKWIIPFLLFLSVVAYMYPPLYDIINLVWAYFWIVLIACVLIGCQVYNVMQYIEKRKNLASKNNPRR